MKYLVKETIKRMIASNLDRKLNKNHRETHPKPLWKTFEFLLQFKVKMAENCKNNLS